LLLVAIGALAVCVAARPSVAAYALTAMTPLTAGIDRGAAIPLLRPNEALAAVVGAALIGRGLLLAREGVRPHLRLSEIEWALLAMAVASSVIPLLWMSLRHQEISRDDQLYALVLWKFAAVYLIVRVSIRTEAQVRRCLYLSIGAATVVAVIAILQALNLLNVRGILATYYLPNGDVGALAKPRGGSTLSLPAAVADLMIYNLALVAGLVAQRVRHWLLLCGVGVLFVLAAVSAGEFSSALGLVIGAVLVAVMVRKPRVLLLSLPLGAVVAVALWPVISARLAGFQSVSGLPVSWTGRLNNLENYFVPPLMSNGQLPARGPPERPDRRAEPSDRLRLDRERLHLVALGRRHPAAARVRLVRPRDGRPVIQGRPDTPGRRWYCSHRPTRGRRRHDGPHAVRPPPDLPRGRRRAVHPGRPCAVPGQARTHQPFQHDAT